MKYIIKIFKKYPSFKFDYFNRVSHLTHLFVLLRKHGSNSHINKFYFKTKCRIIIMINYKVHR